MDAVQSFRRSIVKVATLVPAIVLIALGFAACQMPDATGGPNSTGEKAIKLMDGNGNFVGYVIGTSTGGVGIHTSKGYFFGYGWDGVPGDGLVYFAGADGTGTKFYKASSGYEIVGFATMMGGLPYVAATVDELGGAVSNPGITSYRSEYWGGAIHNYSLQSLGTCDIAIPLKQATFADIGAPSSIAPLKEAHADSICRGSP